MTRDEYFGQDVIERLQQAKEVLLGDDALPFPEGGERDQLVFLDDGIGINVSDVISDAVIAIKRLRAADDAPNIVVGRDFCLPDRRVRRRGND